MSNLYDITVRKHYSTFKYIFSNSIVFSCSYFLKRQILFLEVIDISILIETERRVQYVIVFRGRCTVAVEWFPC
jgi:hypothetical protein